MPQNQHLGREEAKTAFDIIASRISSKRIAREIVAELEAAGFAIVQKTDGPPLKNAEWTEEHVDAFRAAWGDHSMRVNTDLAYVSARRSFVRVEG